MSGNVEDGEMMRALRGENGGGRRVPVWMMRQAGRYLPEFRATRADVGDFFALCRTPEKVAEVTCQPVDRYGALLSAAILFSDILVVPQALGLEVRMEAGVGPVLPAPLRGPADLARLDAAEAALGRLDYVYAGIRASLARLAGRAPLLGFAGAPWTLLCYMTEGGGSKDWAVAKTWLFAYPDAARRLLALLTECVAGFLLGQIAAGVHAAQVFDSWAGVLAPDDFRAFVLPTLAAIADRVHAVHPRFPLILFAKGANECLPDLAGLGYAVLGVDWTVSPEAARAATGDYARVGLQGNLDPALIFSDEETIRARTIDMLRRFGPGPSYIANFGHGCMPSFDPEKVRVFLQAVADFQPGDHGET